MMSNNTAPAESMAAGAFPLGVLPMYMVYWSIAEAGERLARSREFASSEMSAAMAFIEELRARQRAGENISFVTLCSENPDSVGPAGVAETGPDYDWKKRRK